MSSGEILVVEQQARRVVKGKVNRIRVGRPQQENLPITASYQAGSFRGRNFSGGVVNTTKMSLSHTAGSAKIFAEFTQVSVPAD